jgi:isoleucyl-tRNA synthetase
MPDEKDPASKIHPAVQAEEDVLAYWDEHKIFERSLEKTANGKPYVFYDGPPFATGLPHYGSILPSVVKDAIPRYWTMKGYSVRRRWGWDCHGLPIEQLVEKKLGISGKKQIEEIGIAKFNETCRENVLGYVHEWGKTIHRIGRWVDFDNSYKTMDSTYMESVWWALKQVWDKDLVYEGRKVLLYCPRCETPLSNFEVAMDNSYSDVTEDSVYVQVPIVAASLSSLHSPLAEKLKSLNEPAHIVFWTTTAWSIPGDVALAVGNDIGYSLVRDSRGLFIVASEKVETLFNGAEVLYTCKGSELVGISYVPPFDLPDLRSEKSFKVYDADFVTTEDGTGIVHTAVAYGEDDYNLGQRVGLPIVPMITQNGLFNEVAPEFLRGKYYRKAEPFIMEQLEANGNLFKSLPYTHSVPHCWRCSTRLFYNAIPAWFISIQKIKAQLLEANRDEINWYPHHLKEGRFQKGIESAPDWNISRNRYWATPLPFWRCTSRTCGRVSCIGSLEELRERATNYNEVYASKDIREVDLHRPQIDKVTLECAVCGNEMQRVEEVVDCWVESGSMPFAELHYPFENKDEFAARYPAQFVSEYIAQTRAWFYVMHVVGTTLFGHAPFQNVLVTGVIAGEDGQKMSKSKGNYPDPALVFNQYGVDAVRFYLMTSPLMSGENISFSEKEVDEVYKKLILMLHNVLAFLRTYSTEKFEDGAVPESRHVLDTWILVRLHQLQAEVTENLDRYDLVRAGRPILDFVNDLSTWYVRRSRDRMRTSADEVKVLAYVLVELSKLLAPFTPFIAEHVYRDLTGNESVHLADWNSAAASQPLSEDDRALLTKMQNVRAVVELGLSARKEANMKVRQPLQYASYTGTPQLGEELEQVIAEELNVKEVIHAPELSVLGETVLRESGDLKVLLSTALTPELKEEGYSRELERQVQDLRKRFGLNVGDMIDVYYNTQDTVLEMALVNGFDRKKTFTVQVKKELEVEADFEAQVEVDGRPIWLGIVKL